ncbi:3'-5' exonuclease [Pseudomaricurvus alkylphenolicus]|uniref:3'-5' exonuclease n=1 Tax=Pseudomaricurvus alkylphenolicus TaxID=1306991 RepID=UPI00142110E7|nr:3'-5' exonuclease [Pseudomaricurvus alkylphenolicus]NIB43769.1 3'-5' exonuclease [Pseudomaricurvus alkylphenolicus]
MSNLILFYDTEGTGLPEWKQPSGSDVQPHIVQLAGILADADTREIVSTMDVIIKPDGWVIPEEVTEIHGITNEHALEVGIDESVALNQFISFWDGCKRVAHNRTYDMRMIRIAAKRYGDEALLERWGEKDDHDCTMLLSKPVLQIPSEGRGRYKNPKLEEAYKHFTGKDLENAHTAMADAQACMEVYWGLQDLKQEAAA